MEESTVITFGKFVEFVKRRKKDLITVELEKLYLVSLFDPSLWHRIGLTKRAPREVIEMLRDWVKQVSDKKEVITNDSLYMVQKLEGQAMPFNSSQLNQLQQLFKAPRLAKFATRDSICKLFVLLFQRNRPRLDEVVNLMGMHIVDPDLGKNLIDFIKTSGGPDPVSIDEVVLLLGQLKK